MLPVYGHDQWSGTSQEVVPVNQIPARSGTGEPLHRLDPVPVRGSFPPVSRFSKWQEYRSHRTKSVGLYHPTQRTHIQVNMSTEVRGGCHRHRRFHLYGREFLKKTNVPHKKKSPGREGYIEKGREDVDTHQGTDTLVAIVRKSSRESGVISMWKNRWSS